MKSTFYFVSALLMLGGCGEQRIPVRVEKKEYVPPRVIVHPAETIPTPRGPVARLPWSEKILEEHRFTVRLRTHERKKLTVSPAMFQGVDIETDCLMGVSSLILECP